MKGTFKLVSALLFGLCSKSHGADINLTANDGFVLKADYFASERASDRAVLMLHQCNYNRTMYDNIGAELAKHGVHALSLDFRGYGESVSEEFDVEKVFALPQPERRTQWRKMAENWPMDVKLAYDFLVDKAGDSANVGVIGASCGGSQAIRLAEQHPVKALSFFSSAQREENIGKYQQQLAKKPTLIIAAEQDDGTYSSGQTLFASAQHQNSRFIAYKGDGHGYPLLELDSHLAASIVAWFNNQL